MQERAGLVRATTGMAVVTVFSRLSGLIRDKVLAAFLGPTGIGDAFTVGFRAPNLFRQLLAEGALHATFIPTLAELEAGGQRRRSEAFVGAMFSTLLLLLAIILVLGMMAAEPLAFALAPTYRKDPEKFQQTVYFTRYLFPYLGFVSLAALFQGLLNVSGRFLLPAGTPIALNLSIASSILLAKVLGLDLPSGLVVGVLVGGGLQFLLQWAQCLRLGLPVLPGPGAFRNADVRRVLQKAGPLVFSSGIYPLTVFLSTNLAARAGEGAVFCLYVASRVNELVYGVVVVQLFTAALPALASAEDKPGTLGFALRLQSVLVFPSMFFLIALPQPVIGLLFGGGRFQPWAVELTGAVLVFLALGMPALALGKLLSGAFYARHETRMPVVGSLIALSTFALFGSALVGVVGVVGIALALSLSHYASAFWLWTALRKRGWAPGGEVWYWVRRHGLAGTIMAAPLVIIGRMVTPPQNTSAGAAGFVAAMGLLALALYLGISRLLGAGELGEVWNALRGKS
ncbi:MAG: murein biosynthesis integral membrane protein MurJ [Thermoanaerobaculaceae bacterium]